MAQNVLGQRQFSLIKSRFLVDLEDVPETLILLAFSWTRIGSLPHRSVWFRDALPSKLGYIDDPH